MDIFDEMLNKTPKEKFIEIIKNGNLGALEKTFDNFFAEYIAMIELLEQQKINDKDVKKFILENDELIKERQNDIFIGLSAEILGYEG
ncbi:DUF2018 family protein [Campylobacter novaezeelandiae]|uniref:DUF2018 family protein n=1 Tax=Campylobacter novaezeelandiae TaxID=2267891 RepID=UPI001037441D|nr:DUF2018 family protein [Campylobacter novaezeelandiae]TBR82730.1 DUF2018 family protein [Campylobacter novaezeelandiae]